MHLTAKELAALVNGEVEGDAEVKLSRPCRIEEGETGGISFLGNPKYESYLYETKASAILVPRKFKLRKKVDSTLIRVDNVYNAVALLLNHFEQGDFLPEGIAEEAHIHPEAHIGEDVSIGPFTVVEAGARIGKGCRIGAQVYIGAAVQLGEAVSIHPGARILHHTVVGHRCTIQANAVVGAIGFGYTLDEEQRYRNIPQLGNVVLEDDVDIGAGTTIDRASMGSTIIRRGAKIDNLVQVAHNVTIGPDTVIAAQSGVAGSSKIGARAQLGGQTGVAGHLSVADGVKVQAQSGIASNIGQEGQALYGSPAMPYHEYLRAYALFRKLPALQKRIEQLEKKLNAQGETTP